MSCVWKNTSYENVICAERKKKKEKAIKSIRSLKKSWKLSATVLSNANIIAHFNVIKSAPLHTTHKELKIY